MTSSDFKHGDRVVIVAVSFRSERDRIGLRGTVVGDSSGYVRVRLDLLSNSPNCSPGVIEDLGTHLASRDELRRLDTIERIGELTGGMMTLNDIAAACVTALQQNTAPGSCTWGDEHPLAHGELFGTRIRRGYRPDMAADIERTLRRCLPKLEKKPKRKKRKTSR